MACGTMGLLRRGPGQVPAGQEVARAVECRQILAGDPEIPRGGVEGPLAQEHLDRPDIDARFEEVRRKTMAHRISTLPILRRSLRAVIRIIPSLGKP